MSDNGNTHEEEVQSKEESEFQIDHPSDTELLEVDDDTDNLHAENSEGNPEGNHDGDTNGEDNRDTNGEEVNGDQPTRKKRGLPKTFQANQEKYMAALEKKQKMMSNAKNKKSPLAKHLSNTANEETPVNKTQNQQGMRRMIIAGKVKYVPINSNPNTPTDAALAPAPSTSNVAKPQKEHISKQADHINITDVETAPSNDVAPSKIPIGIAKKMNKYNEMKAKNEEEQGEKAVTKEKTQKKSGGKKLPGRYSKQLEKEIKKQTVKKVKNFADLRRVRALENVELDEDVDTNRASIAELRKLRIEQRKREQAENKKQAINTRESAVQAILSDDKMTKFSKAIAIKNLSVTSRHKKKPRSTMPECTQETSM